MIPDDESDKEDKSTDSPSCQVVKWVNANSKVTEEQEAAALVTTTAMPACELAKKSSVSEKYVAAREEAMLVDSSNIDSVLTRFIPKTAKECVKVINHVKKYIGEENEREKEMKRKRKAKGNTASSKLKRTRPNTPTEEREIPLAMRVYLSLGIYPWNEKNKACLPADDNNCAVKIPDCVKKAVLRYRQWYPTMHDKLYCFEGHSYHLCDLKLFGCWECIRKYYSEIYRWAFKVGLVRESMSS